MNILIVDDEPVFTEQLRFIIEKNIPMNTKTKILETYSALEALDRIPSFNPDLIMTDIKMDAMDGIAFSEVIHQRWPEVTVVIISGYSSFDYARNALRANVFDYLLKPIDPKTVVDLLIKVEKQVRQKKYLQMKRGLQSLIDTGNIAHSDRENLRTEFDDFSLFFIQRSDVFLDPTTPLFHYQYEQRFLSNIKEQMNLDSYRLFLIPQPHGFVILVGRTEGESFALDDFLREISSFFTIDGRPLSFIYLPSISSIDKIHGTVKKMRNKLHTCLIIGKPQVIRYDEGSPEKGKYVEPGFQSIYETQIESAFMQRDWQKAKTGITRLFDAWKDIQYPTYHIVTAMHKMVRFLCKTLNQDTLKVRLLEEGIEEILIYAGSFEEAATAIWELVNHELGLSLSPTSTLDKAEAKFLQINAYLKEHMSEPITLSTLCEQFQLSSTSMYNLFRRYGKMSFIEYLTSLRIEQAKHLLLERPELLAREIAEYVGYLDQHYFSRVFKSMVGMTPTEYRDANLNR